MALKPHIIHVVGFTEADHAATAEDVVESCKLARRAIENALSGAPDMLSDPKIKARIKWLVNEANLSVQAIRNLHKTKKGDPLTNPETLTKAVTSGILDAPQLKNNPFARGKIETRIINGACVPVDPAGKTISEKYRIDSLS
jgi:hypothetical protein